MSVRAAETKPPCVVEKVVGHVDSLVGMKKTVEKAATVCPDASSNERVYGSLW